ncbi:hypothetical protein [uncultured Dysosmobacter sp.]|uniref:hypothetical protein n=1 Tax=uncultured Dysosmobacter sp. TaxID=2591384 RepID=UPI002626A07F|nr:hypothetical protein [uncultured Dysosmobacter sp.]
MNQNCARDLLLYLSEHLRPTASGKMPRPVKIRSLPDLPEFSDYAREDLFEAAQYLRSKKLIQLTTDGISIPSRSPKQHFAVPASADPAPKAYVVKQVTAAGLDYCAELRKNTLWNRLLQKFPGSAMEQALSVPAALLSRLLLDHLP